METRSISSLFPGINRCYDPVTKFEGNNLFSIKWKSGIIGLCSYADLLAETTWHHQMQRVHRGFTDVLT